MALPKGFRQAFRGFVDPDDTSSPEPGSGEVPLALGPPPARFDWRASGRLSPVRAQGNCNTCTSFAASAVIETMHLLRTSQPVRLAPGFIHRCLLNRPCETGATAREVLTSVSASGVALGFAGDEPFPPGQCGTNNRLAIRQWGWIETLDLILGVVASDGPLLAEMFIDERFLSLRTGDVYVADMGRRTLLHSVAVVGYDIPAGWALVQNSFGPGWADHGFGRVTFGSGNFLTRRGAFRIAA